MDADATVSGRADTPAGGRATPPAPASGATAPYAPASAGGAQAGRGCARDRLAWPLLVGLASVLALAATVTFSLYGHTAVVAHLFYVPVILASYRYQWHGLFYDIGLAVLYMGAVSIAFAADPAVVSAAAFQALALVAVGALVAWLATAVRDAERRATVQRDLAVRLEAARSRDEVAEATAQALARLPECDACAVYVGTPDEGYMLVAREGISDAFAERIRDIEAHGPRRAVVLADGPIWDTYLRIAQRAGVDDDPVRRAEGLCGTGIVPIHFEGDVLGSIVVASRAHHFFRSSTQLCVELIAGEVGASLARLEALVAMHRQHADTEILYEVARELSGTIDAEALLDRIAEQAATAVGAAECALWRYDEESDTEVFLTLFQRDPDPDVKASLIGSRYALADYPEDRGMILGHQVVEHRVGDPATPPSSRRSMEEWGEKTCLHIPLRSGGRPYGLMIIIETGYERHFAEHEVRLLTALGEHAAVAMENAGLYASLERRERRLKALLESSRALTSSVDMERVLHETAAAAAHALDSPQCVLCDYDPELDTLFHRAVYDATPQRSAAGYVGSLVHIVPGGPSWRALHERRPICQRLSDGELDATSRRLMEERGQTTALSIPLVFADRPLGLITLIETERDRRFTDNDIEIAQALADQAAVAINNARLFQSVEALAVHDGLTGLYNHRYFHERLRDEVARARRYDEPLSILMIDIDDFKKVNDSHGHPVGDEILRALAQVLTTQARAGADVAARYGGEELALILPNTPLTRAGGRAAAFGRAAASETGAAAATVAAPAAAVTAAADAEAAARSEAGAAAVTAPTAAVVMTADTEAAARSEAGAAASAAPTAAVATVAAAAPTEPAPTAAATPKGATPIAAEAAAAAGPLRKPARLTGAAGTAAADHPPRRLDGAAAIAERIRAMVSASTYATEQVPGGVHVTVSIGVAGLDGSAQDTAGDLLARADAALYRAKRAGKDRVVLSG